LRGLRGVHHKPPHQARELGGSELSIKARKIISSCFYFFIGDNIPKEVIHIGG